MSGRITAPPSWLASWLVRARAETRTITARPSAATAGATQRIITNHSRVGTKIRCSTGHATAFDTTQKHTKPTQDTTMAGMKAVSSLAKKSSRSVIGQVEQRLEGLALLLAGEGVGGEHRRHHERHDEEQRREQVAVHEHDELLVGGQREDRVGEVAGHVARGCG